MEESVNNSTPLTHSLVIGLLIAISGVAAIEFGLSAAVLEILMGFTARNIIGIYEAEWVEFIAEFGLITLMFIAGFEVDIPILRKNLFKSTVVGGFSFLIPFAGAFLLSMLLGMGERKSLIFAVAMSTTSLALVFPVLRERGMLTSNPGQFLLSSAMIVDILSVVALLLFFIEPGWHLLWGAIAIFLIFIFAPGISRMLFGRWRGNVVEMEVRFILFSLLALLFIANYSEVHGALTGFIFGAVMGSTVRKHFQVEEKIRSIVFSFFAPVFFFRAGTMMDISQIGWQDGFYFLIFTPVAFVLKYGATYHPFKYFKCEVAKFAATLFNYRLSFAIVAALFGLETELISSGEYSAIMCIVLITSLLTAILLKFKPDAAHPMTE